MAKTASWARAAGTRSLRSHLLRTVSYTHLDVYKRQTYYKLIERAHMPVADLAIRLLQLVLCVFPAEVANLIIDDTLVPRLSLIHI